MAINLRLCSIVFIASWLVSLVFYLFPNNLIYSISSVSIILFFGYYCGYKKQKNHQILISTQIYYFLPLIIPMSLEGDLNSLMKLIWLAYISTSLIICLSKLGDVNKKNYPNIVFALLVGIISAKLLYLKIPPHSLIIFTTLAFNALIITKYEKINIKSSIIFLIIAGLSYLIFAKTANFSYKPEIFTALYCIGMSYYCYSNKDNSSSYLATLSFLLIISLFKLTNLTSSLSVAQYGMFCSITILCLIKSPVIYRKKSKYGQLSVVRNNFHNAHILFNDDIMHGVQHIDNNHDSSYYSNSSPLGKVLSKLTDQDRNFEMGVIGLGIGYLALYGKNQNHKISFYEIDEEVIKIAKNPELFTILDKSKANIKIIKGDARKTLEDIPDATYDMLVCDGYFGSFISNSLLTFEALKLYSKKLKEDGILFIHISGMELEQETLERNILALNLVGFTNHHLPKKRTKITNHGLFNFNKKNRLEEDVDYYLQKFLIVTGLYMHSLNDFDSSWIILAKDETYLTNLSLETSWVKIKPKNLQKTELLTDANLVYKN
jgi:spermidine synthase